MSVLLFVWRGAMRFNVWLILCVALLSPAQAADVTVTVHDEKGSPIEGAVVLISSPNVSVNPAEVPVSIDQVNREFEPFLSIVPLGTRITFPNSDNIRHHVYSFSKAKRFEIPLYGGGAVVPGIVVDQPGVIALGCNVHDWMRAYVVVADTPYTAQSNTRGIAVVSLPEGQYTLHVWHPDYRDDESMTVPISVAATGATQKFTLADQPRWRAWRSPSAFEDDY